jgi:phosphopantothenoylcysteine synthetase/decarboxylase
MAKGIRSKCMRKNRSHIRKILSEPIIKKRQEKINEKIKIDLNLKNNGLTIQSISKRLINNKNRDDDNNNDNITDMMIGDDDNNDDELDNDDDEEDEEDNEEFVKGENIAKIPRNTGSRLTSIAVSKAKYTGSKARHNPNKPLVWFK